MNGTGPITEGLLQGEDGRLRCAWAGASAEYLAYHDVEWGRPTGDDDRLYEKLCLEGFQAGLSWITILRKREAFRRNFAGFDVAAVARFGEAEIDRIVADPAIVRHRGKIASAVNNARRVEALRQETGGSFAAFLWTFEPPTNERPERLSLEWARANPVTPVSTRLSKELRRRGFTFVGPTTTYAFLQSMGFVNDHMEDCCMRGACEAARARFVRPG